MGIVQAIILAIVEGITEFLPVSSTGHLILTAKLLGVPTTEFSKSFEIFIQLGAIMAVVSLYWQRIIETPKLIKPLIISFIPTAIAGILLYKIVKTYLLGMDMLVVAMLAGVGAILIALEFYWKSHPAKTHKTALTLSPVQLVAIGIFQAFAIVPGVSRSAATIIGGMFMGLPRTEAVEFSFLLAVPTIAAAAGLDLIKSSKEIMNGNLVLLVVGFIVSWITALVIIKLFMHVVKKTTFIGFGIYRILVAFFYWLALLR